jgi:tetratricopeptide (TPR) repeat protein
MLIGKVITEEGLPLEGVTVKLNSVTDTKTDISGRFFFNYLSYGKYNISFVKDGYLSAEYPFDFNLKIRKTQPVVNIKMFSTNYLVNEGFEFLKEKKFNDAFDIIQKLEKINPDEDTVLYLKAVYDYFNAGFSEALTLLEKLKLRDRKNIYYQLTLCDVYEKLQMSDKEADLAFYLATNNPREYFSYFQKAADLYKKLNNQDEYQKAINEYNKSLNKYGEKKR